MKSIIKKGKKEKDWFRLKIYPHIGMQLKPKDRGWIEAYVKNEEKIATHAFYPFIHRELKVRRFRKEVCHDGTRSKLRKPTTKEREIYFSNHFDSNIFSYYSEILSDAYEKQLNKLQISDCVTAYRKIKLNPNDEKSRNKCNIDFANDVFQFIKSKKQQDLVAITFDITKFFDNLNHSHLKKCWMKVIGSEAHLPKNHYNVFRNITKFSYVEEDDLFNLFKNKILVERKLRLIKKVKVDKVKYLRNKRAIAYCTKENIKLIRESGLIKNNKYIYDSYGKKVIRKKGIPQGSAISATLANIYMLDFDKRTNDFLESIGGLYRRYSDDMVAVCPIDFENEVIDHFMTSIKGCKLEIQESKTQEFYFRFDESTQRHICYEKNLNTKKTLNNKLFEYLGFQFDGFYTLIKNSSLSNYYRKMKKSFARSCFFAYHNKTKTKGKVFKSRLYKKFTFKGAKRRRIYQRHPSKSNVFIKSNIYDWGNFITYANLARDIIPNNKIRGQLKNHWKKFHELMKKIEKK